MKCKKKYADEEKYRQYRNGCNARYYKRTEDAPNKKTRWSDAEIDMIMDKKFSDSQLASMLGRSMRSIQIKRSRMIRQEY